MTVYSYSQLEGLWTGAGGSAALAPLMAAIAKAESGGSSTAANPLPCGSGSHAQGLWQICMPLNQQYVPGGNAFNPQANAAAAVAIQKAQGLGAWSTYSGGQYKAYYNGRVPPSAVAPGAATNAASQGASATLATYNAADCLVGIPNVNPIPSWVPGVGQSSGFCLFSKSEARGTLGGLLMAVGGSVGVVGVLILAAYGLKASGAARAAGQVLELIPTPQAQIAGRAVAAAGRKRPKPPAAERPPQEEPAGQTA